jgi:hypothetical protein
MEGTERRPRLHAVRPDPTAAWDAFVDCYLSTANRAAVDTFLAGLAALGRRSAA